MSQLPEYPVFKPMPGRREPWSAEIHLGFPIAHPSAEARNKFKLPRQFLRSFPGKPCRIRGGRVLRPLAADRVPPGGGYCR